MRTCAGIATMLVLGLAATNARAAGPVEEKPTVHHIGVSAVAGLGTPVGWGGLEAQADLARWLVLSAGAGAGLSSGAPQLATMARLRWVLREGPTGEAALTGGYGVSVGRYSEGCFPHFGLDCGPDRSAVLWWHNLELAIEIRGGSGRFPVLARAFGGLGLVGNPGALPCSGACAPGAGGRPLPFFGLALGLLLR